VTGDCGLQVLVLAGGTAVPIVRIEDFIAGFGPR
jgi:hypothetical protein